MWAENQAYRDFLERQPLSELLDDVPAEGFVEGIGLVDKG